MNGTLDKEEGGEGPEVDIGGGPDHLQWWPKS